jgi:hypothetical protein
MAQLGTTVVVTGLALGLLGGTAGASHGSAIAQAKKGLLVLSDMPKGWTSAKGSGNGSGKFPGDKQLASCIGVSTKVITANPPTANSREFNSKNQYLSVNESIGVFPSTKAAQAQVVAYANPKTPGCMTTLVDTGSSRSAFAKDVGSGASVGSITATRTPAADVSAGTSGLTITVNVVTQGVTVPLEITQVVGVKGKEGYQLILTSVGTPFTASLSRHLTQLALTRL